MAPIIIFFIILSVLVLIHEMGHFLAAKKFGIKVEEFGLGYPPKMWGKKIGETIYSINWLPFGGFVRIFGEDWLEEKSQPKAGRPRAEKNKDSHRTLYDKPKKVRALVSIAGVFGNFILGIICFSIIYSFMGIPTKVDYVFIDAVAPGSPAQKVGLSAGDRIVSINDHPVKTTDEFINLVKENAGQETKITAVPKEGGLVKEFLVSPRANPPEGQGALGVAISSSILKFYPVWQMPARSAWVGIGEAIGWGIMILQGLVLTVKNLIAGVAPEVAGPIGIYQITSTVVKEGWMLTLQFVGVLSINLAILNLLPLPALDGGRLFFIIIEAISGRRVKPQIEQYVHMAGMAFLITLMLLVTYNDLLRLLGGNQFLVNLFNSITNEILKTFR